MATISGFVFDLGGIGSCSFFAAAGLAAIGRAIAGGLAGLATGDLAMGDLVTTGFCFDVAAVGVDAEVFESFGLESFLESFLLEAILLRFPAAAAPLTGAAILMALVFALAAFTAADFGVEALLASGVFDSLDLPLAGLVEAGFATTFLLGANFLLGAGLEAEAVPFFAELFWGALLAAAPFAGFTPLATVAAEEGCFPREVAPPGPELAGDLVFDFAGFLAGGTGGSPG